MMQTPSTAGFVRSQMITLSAPSAGQLRQYAIEVRRILGMAPEPDLADVCFLLQTRAHDQVRGTWVAYDIPTAVSALQAEAGEAERTLNHTVADRPVAMLLPGIGDQYPAMGESLYEIEPVFRDSLAECGMLCRPLIGCELLDVLYPPRPCHSAALEPRRSEEADGPDFARLVAAASAGGCDPFERPTISHPVLFAVEYALARLCQSWGLEPTVLAGYSLGEYVAACLAGIMSLADALKIVVARAQLIESLEAGAMLAVPVSEAEVHSLLTDHLEISAVNAPRLCVVSGPIDEVVKLQAHLRGLGIATVRIRTSHAYHCSLMDPIAGPFTRVMQTIRLSPPRLPVVSSMTGRWLTAEEAMDPTYFPRQLCMPVRFADGLQCVLANADFLIVEAGPGRTLAGLALQNDASYERPSISLMPSGYDNRDGHKYLIEAVARAWVAGVSLGREGLYPGERRPVHASSVSLVHSLADQARAAAPATTEDGCACLPYGFADAASIASIEQALCRLWEQLLGGRPSSVRDNLFDRGLNSLTAVRFLISIQEHYGIDLPLRAIYEGPTIGMLADAIADALLTCIEGFSNEDAVRELGGADG